MVMPGQGSVRVSKSVSSLESIGATKEETDMNTTTHLIKRDITILDAIDKLAKRVNDITMTFGESSLATLKTLTGELEAKLEEAGGEVGVMLSGPVNYFSLLAEQETLDPARRSDISNSAVALQIHANALRREYKAEIGAT